MSVTVADDTVMSDLPTAEASMERIPSASTSEDVLSPSATEFTGLARSTAGGVVSQTSDGITPLYTHMTDTAPSAAPSSIPESYDVDSTMSDEAPPLTSAGDFDTHAASGESTSMSVPLQASGTSWPDHMQTATANDESNESTQQGGQRFSSSPSETTSDPIRKDQPLITGRSDVEMEVSASLSTFHLEDRRFTSISRLPHDPTPSMLPSVSHPDTQDEDERARGGEGCSQLPIEPPATISMGGQEEPSSELAKGNPFAKTAWMAALDHTEHALADNAKARPRARGKAPSGTLNINKHVPQQLFGFTYPKPTATAMTRIQPLAFGGTLACLELQSPAGQVSMTDNTSVRRPLTRHQIPSSPDTPRDTSLNFNFDPLLTIGTPLAPNQLTDEDAPGELDSDADTSPAPTVTVQVSTVRNGPAPSSSGAASPSSASHCFANSLTPGASTSSGKSRETGVDCEGFPEYYFEDYIACN